jgi:RNA polymerase II subunit A small phosphatase-like protein
LAVVRIRKENKFMEKTDPKRQPLSKDDSETEMKREESTVATGDVQVTVAVTSDLQSMVTQVSRDAPSRPTIPVHNYRNNRAEARSPRRSFFSRLLCCASKPVVNGSSGGQIGLVAPTTHSSFIAPRKTSGFGSFTLSSSKQDRNKAANGKPQGKKCLALDLDETLVHSSFQPVDGASFVISVVIEGIVHNVYVMKRPGVDEFMERLAPYYELIVFTASLSKYADPLLDLLDTKRVISKRLFREHCVFYDGHYVKDLSMLNRDISQTIIVDNSPMSYIFHPENAIDCSSFFDNPVDVELYQIADFLEHIHNCDDVRAYCRHWREWCKNHPSSAPIFSS